jgi:glycosyltransferase involved in cell wall biosynthesis
VLHLITEFALGGAQDNTFLTVKGLNRDRFQVDLAAAPGGNWESLARSVADRVFIIPSMKRGIYAFQNGRALLEIMALLKKQHYHIVHTHSTNAGILGRLAAKLVGTPIIVHTVHGFPFNDLTFSPTIRKILIWLERGAAHCSDQLVMVSELNKIEALQKRIAPADKMVTIHSGIDLTRFKEPVDIGAKRRELSLDDGWPLVGMVGRLSECNAPDVFVQAALRVLKGRSEVHFVIVGDGPLYFRVQTLAKGLPQIKFLGYRSDVPEILPTFDVFVFPIRWGGLGRALTEAMITGRPLVASAVNGVPEIVNHTETGLLVPPDDPEAIAKSVCYLLDNPDFAKRLGQNARTLVVPEFSADLMVQRIIGLYQKLLLKKDLTNKLCGLS